MKPCTPENNSCALDELLTPTTRQKTAATSPGVITRDLSALHRRTDGASLAQKASESFEANGALLDGREILTPVELSPQAAAVKDISVVITESSKDHCMYDTMYEKVEADAD